MENILSLFTANNLEIKLTSEKLFINTATSNEAFALRSLNGIGVVDLVGEYNKALSAWKSERFTAIIFIGLSIFILLISLGFALKYSASPQIGLIVIGLLSLILGLYYFNKTNKPTLMSAVRIMMSGGNRDFQFDKTGSKSGNVAEFVANVESTLTSYYKKID